MVCTCFNGVRTGRCVPIREVSSFQRVECTGFNRVLGPEDVSLLERCPHFRGWYVQASMECPYRSVLNWCYVQFWMARFCLQQESASTHQTGMEYLLQAAENGHRAAMIELARALDTGRTEEQENGSIQSDSKYIHTVIYH